jgi:plasmid maintenance system antidote protein VapI
MTSLKFHLPHEVLKTLLACAAMRGVSLEQLVLDYLNLGLQKDPLARQALATWPEGYFENLEDRDIEVSEHPGPNLTEKLLTSLRTHGLDEDLLERILADRSMETVALLVLLALGEQEIEMGLGYSAEEVFNSIRARIREQALVRSSRELAAEIDGPSVGREFGARPALPTSRIPNHPGEVLFHEFMPDGLIKIPGVSPQMVLELILGEGRITPRLAKSLSTAFGTTVEFWANLQANHDAYTHASAPPDSPDLSALINQDRDERGPSQAWLRENLDSIPAYNARVETQGTFRQGAWNQEPGADLPPFWDPSWSGTKCPACGHLHPTTAERVAALSRTCRACGANMRSIPQVEPPPEHGATTEPAMDTRNQILRFRREYVGRYGTMNSSLPFDIGQILGLQEARLQVMALLLEVDSDTLTRFLDRLVWESDLSESHLSAARNESGLPNPVLSRLNSPRLQSTPGFELLSNLLEKKHKGHLAKGAPDTAEAALADYRTGRTTDTKGLEAKLNKAEKQ